MYRDFTEIRQNARDYCLHGRFAGVFGILCTSIRSHMYEQQLMLRTFEISSFHCLFKRIRAFVELNMLFHIG